MGLGIKHLIECHCTLALYKKNKKTIYHKFPVYSKFDSSNKIIPKLAKCNNCETMHYVYEVCKSEIRAGKDESSITITKEDIIAQIPMKLTNILSQYDSDISNWEHALDVLEEERWGESLVLKREVINENEQIKIITILGRDRFKISNQVINQIM